MNSTILRAENLQVTLAGKIILRDISMEIKSGEQWAVSGETGSGKTILAHTFSGHHFFRGILEFPENENADYRNSVMVVDFQHRFRDLQNQTNFYYQQRYNAFDSESTISVAEDLAVFPEDQFGLYSKNKLLDIFQLTKLLNEPLVQLSNGENKRLQILKAVLCRYRLLILDEPFTGLDITGRQTLNQMLTAVSGAGQSLLYFTNRNYIPECFNRFGFMKQGSLRLNEISETANCMNSPGVFVKQKSLPVTPNTTYPDFRYAVRMQKVIVEYSGRTILKNISWEIEKAACWSLTGPNGSGKSTLLSLITADNPQAYANEIYLFDRKRGSGESIWEIKRKIGFLSPELQLYFDPGATVFSAIASGLFDTIGLFRSLDKQQEECVLEWLQFMDLTDYTHRLLSSLPAGLQRLVLLARALVKMPPLLVMDEPCQGLDASQTRFVQELIDHYCTQWGAGLIYVSHYSDEFPACISQHLRLEDGVII